MSKREREREKRKEDLASKETPKDKILAAYMHDLKGNVTLANTPYIGYSRSF